MNTRIAMIALSGLIVVSPQIAGAWNEPSGFRDIPFGASEQTLKEKLPRPMCHDNNDQEVLPERYCFVSLRIGSVDASGIFYLRSDHFVNLTISFKSEVFSQIEEAFTEKYGTPLHTQDVKIKTRGGLEAVNTVMKWDGKKVDVRLQRYAGSITNGFAELIMVEEREIQRQKIESRGKAGAKDL